MKRTNKKQQRVLLVVDMIEGFYRIGNLKNPGVATIIEPIEALLRKIPEEGGEIIFITDKHTENDKEFELFPPHAVEPAEREIIKELQEPLSSLSPKYWWRINKNTYSAFHTTELNGALKNIKPKEIIIVGVCTDICVLYNAFDAIREGYEVTIPKDCVTTYDGSNHDVQEINKIFLEHMENILGVRVVETWKDI